jgi:carboxymethylenebutenolidase
MASHHFAIGSSGAGGEVVKPPASPGEPSPVVVLLPAIAGINDYVLRVAGRLSEHGYAVLALDYFARRGGPPDLSTPEQIMAAVASVDDAEVVKDVGAALDELRGDRALDAGRAAVLGLCIGGSLALLAGAALGERLSCVAAFYGLIRYAELTDNKPRAPIDAAEGLEIPLIGHWGDSDHLVPLGDVHALREVLRGRRAEVCVYPGAGHAFHEDHRPVFRPVAAAEAWQRTLLYLDHYLGNSTGAPFT